MGLIILDCGSGNTCNNDIKEARRMIDAIKDIDTKKHEIVIKWQMWAENNPQGNNKILDFSTYIHIAQYCGELGYQCTASVFDKQSLCNVRLVNYPKYIKIACRKSLYPLIGEIERKITVLVSVDNEDAYRGYYQEYSDTRMKKLFCVPKYPATIDDYLKLSDFVHMANISDHTKDLELYKKWKPEIYECHFALPGQTGLDVECGICKTPDMLKEIL